MLGCDLHCGYCQNWVTSQALRDPAAVAPPQRRRRPTRWCRTRVRQGARVVVSTYNEPLITGEWAVAVFKEARERAAWRPASSRTATARRRCSSTCGRGSISTRSISRASTTGTTASSAAGCSRSSTPSARLHARGFWVEIVTLLDPRLQRLARRADAADRVPRRRLARHPVARDRVPQDYKMTDPANTTAGDAACEPPRSARAAGLRYVYAGNLPGQVGDLGAHPLRGVRRAARHRAYGYHDPRLPAHAGRRLCPPAARQCRAAGAPRSTASVASLPFCPTTAPRLRMV